MKKIIFALSLVAALVGFGETMTIDISAAAGLQKELSADDVLVVNVSGNSDQSAVDWTGITGTGTIKFQGTGVVTLPNDGYRFAETLSLDSSSTLKLGSSWRTTGAGTIQTPFKVRNLSGSAPFNRYSNTARNHLRTEQTKVTEWSGVLENSYSYNGTQYGVYIWVASDGSKPSKDKALIVSGNQTSAQTLRIESTGCVILKGQWKGTIENNGLLIIAPGVDRSQFTVTGSGTTELQQANEVIVIAPPALKTMWEEEFAPAYAEIHPGYNCSVVSTADIYEDYPYVATNTDGAPRNPAESIHAFIKNANLKDGNQYFILGGPWVNIDDLATNKVMKLATGESLTLDNTVPGVRINTYKDSDGNIYHSPSDMYYACFDSNNTYAWDADGNGMYLESTEFTNSDMTANVIVTRIPLVTYSEWKHENGTAFTQKELLTAYIEKLRSGLSASFNGMNRYGFYANVIDIENKGGGTGREITVQKLGGDCDYYVERTETAFYDGGYNMFDPARGNDRFVLAEGVSRRHIRDQIAKSRPVDDVNGFYEETFSSKHKTREEARSSWKGDNYALRFYYAHGARGGGHGFSMDDYKSSGCGLTLFDDCAGPCSTGKIEFDANGVYLMNYAIGCVMSPFGGSLTTINNTDYGIGDMNNFFKGFQPNDSWRYANNYLVGFVQENMNVGEAWKYNVTDFVENYRYNKSGLDTWMLAEEMLLGDPLVKLPAVETELPFADGITYKGIRGKTDAMVKMAVEGDKAIESAAKFKIMDGLTTSGNALTLATGEGGIGGDGVTFTGGKGTLTLTGGEPFYVAGVRNGEKVVIRGTATLDFDAFDISALEIGEGANVTIRSNTRGALAKIGNTLTIPANATVRLATWDAFGDEKGTITVGAGAQLLVGANPSYHDGNNRGETLNAEINFTSESATLDISVAKGGYFTPGEPLIGDARVTYTIDARDGLGGEVAVPSDANLTLKELPLSKIETLTVESGATLVIPEGKTLDELLSAGTATIKVGAKVAVGVAEPETIEEEKTIDGANYVAKSLYYTTGATDWSASVKGSINKNEQATETITEGQIVKFAKDIGPVYIHDDVKCSKIEVVDGANLKIGYWDGMWTIPSNWTVDIEDGSTLTIARWSNETAGAVKIGDNVVLNGEGVATFANTVTSATCGNISGTAMISLPAGVTITSSGKIANTIIAPEGYKVRETVNGNTTTYSVVDKDAIDPTAFGKTWTYFYTGAGNELATAANWSTVVDGKYVAMDKAPLLSSSNLWEPALFDGERMVQEIGEDGYKHIISTSKVEGWNLRIGLANGVCLTLNELQKLQIGQGQYAYIDDTSRLIVKKLNDGKTLTMPFYIAAEEGLVWEAESTARNYTFVYSFSGNGSAKFIGTSDVATHKIAAAEITLGEGDGKEIRSKKLVKLNSAKSNTTGWAFDSNATITTDDPEVVGVAKATDVTTSDPIGTCSLRKEDDGVYLDYVGRKEVVPAIATVVRAHPRLTRGLDKESLLGIRFDNSYGGAPSEITVRFDFVNCSADVVSNVQLWRMPFDPLPAAFYEAKAKPLCEAETVEATEQKLRVTFAATEHIYPCVDSRAESDYLWVTASIDENIPIDAEIYVSVENETISLGASVYTVKNGAAVSPHRVFPYYYQIGAYFRSDRVTANSCAPLGNATEERVENLTDLILINNMWVGRADDGSLYANWPEGESAKVAYMKSLRDRYNPKAMVRLGLTKGSNMDEIGDKTKRAQLVESIVAIMSETGVDGLDVDWEYPENANQWRCYGLLLRDLAAEFFDRGWVLSICTNLGHLMPDNNYHTVFHAADYIDSMAYGGRPINASPGVMKTGIAVCTQRGVPSRRIVVGQAMYAYENGNPGWGSVVKWIKAQYSDDRTRWWDADYVLKDGTTKETYEGPSSYQAKCNWCRANGYGGVMSWGYYTDTDWNNDDLMSLARHQAKSCWPVETKAWPTPPQDTDGYYLLDSEEDWFWLRDNQGANVRFAADITLDHDPLPIEQRTGVLDGAGHKLIIPKDTWLCYEDNPALIRQLDGTVKNLTIDLYGRVVSRASRWNDTECTEGENKLSTPHTDHCAAVLACKARWGAKVENVTVIIRKGAEVQGPVRTAGLIADVFVSGGNTVSITNSRVIVEGDIHSIARNTAESNISVSGSAVGALAANADLGGASSVTIRNCSVDSVREIALFGNKGAAVTTENTTFTTDGEALAAYLFNCELEDVANKKAEFKFTAEDLEKLMKGEKLETINGVKFNGTLKIYGATTLGDWHEKAEGDKFFKAVLELPRSESNTPPVSSM